MYFDVKVHKWIGIKEPFKDLESQKNSEPQETFSFQRFLKILYLFFSITLSSRLRVCFKLSYGYFYILLFIKITCNSTYAPLNK